MGRGNPELMTGIAWEVWRRDVANPEVIEGLDGGWDVSSQEALGCEGVGGWRRDVSSPDVIEALAWGWDVSSQAALDCDGRPRRRDVSTPEVMGVWMGAGTSRPRQLWVARAWELETGRLQPRRD